MIPELLNRNIARICDTRQQVFCICTTFGDPCPQRPMAVDRLKLLNLLAATPFIAKMFNAIAINGNSKPTKGEMTGRRRIAAGAVMAFLGDPIEAVGEPGCFNLLA